MALFATAGTRGCFWAKRFMFSGSYSYGVTRILLRPRKLTRQLKGDFERALSDLIHCDELAPPGDQGSGNSRALATDSGQRPLDESEYNRRMGAKRWCIGTSGVCSHQGSGSPRQFILPSFQITQVAELTPAAWAARNLPPRMHPTGVNRIFGKTLLFFRHSRVNC